MTADNKSGLGLGAVGLENLEPRLLLTHIGAGGSFTFIDLNNQTVLISLMGSGSVDVFGPGGVDLPPVTVPPPPVIIKMDIDSIHLTGTDSATTLTIVTVNNAGQAVALGTVAGFWSYGADGVTGGGDDIAAPAGTGPIRITGDITSDGPMNRIVIDGLVLGSAVTLGGSTNALYCGYLDADVNVTGKLNYLEVAVDAGKGDPTAPGAMGGLIKADKLGEARVNGTLYKNIEVGENLLPPDFQNPDYHTELEKIGLDEISGRLPNGDDNNTPANAERFAGVGNSLVIDGAIQGRITVDVPPQATYDDFVDVYALDLLPDQPVHITLDSTAALRIVLVKPDGTWAGLGSTTRDIVYTPDNAGEYHLAVVNTVDSSFSLAGSFNAPTGSYEVTIDGLTPISLGSVTAANVGLGIIGVNIFTHQGDIANVTGTTAISASTIDARNGNVLDTNTPTYALDTIQSLGDVGLVEGGTFGTSSILAGQDLMAVRLTGDLGPSTVSANQSIGQVIVAGAITGTSFVANADNLGDPGFINLINVTGDFGSMTAPNTLTTGSGGDVRFVHVGGTVFASEGFSGGWVRMPILFDSTTPADHLSIVDDSGGLLTFSPSAGASGSYITMPVEGGIGVAIVNLTLNGNIGLNISGDVQFGTVDWIPAAVSNTAPSTDLVFNGAQGKADIYELVQTGTANSIVNNTDGSIIYANLGTVGLFSVKSNIGDPSFPNGAPELIHGPAANATAPGGGVIDGILASGDLTTVKADGSIQDVICLGNLGTVTANADHDTPAGQFNGITGFIYGATIGSVDVGDGMIQLPTAQYAEVGIYSLGRITLVTASGVGVRVLAPIMSTTLISKVVASNGASLENLIAAAPLNEYMNGTQIKIPGIAIPATIDWVSIVGAGSKISGATIYARRLNKVTGTGGTDGMLNSYVDGNYDGLGSISMDGPGIIGCTIHSGLGMTNLAITGPTGRLDGTTVYVTTVLGSLTAYDVLSSTVTAESSMKKVTIKHDIQGSTLEGGSAGAITIGGNMEDLFGRRTTLDFAGPIQSVSIKGTATGVINSTGPNASLGKLSSGGPMDMVVKVEGAVGSISTAAGQNMDLDLEISGPRASLGSITSGGYLHGRLVIDGSAKSIISAGELATAGQLLYIDGDVGKIASTGKNGGPTDIAANIIVNGQLKQLVSAGAITGIVQVSRGIGSLQAAGNVSASVLSNTDIKNVAIAGNFSGDITATLDIGNVKVGGAVTGQFTSQQGSIKSVASTGALGGGATAWLDLGKFSSAGDVSADLWAGRNILSVAGASFTGTAVATGNIQAMTFSGDVSGQAKAGIDLQKLSAGSFTGATIAALRNLGKVTATGSAVDSFFLAGFDTGDDLVVGGGDDIATGGNLPAVQLGGDLNNSVIAAGVDPGVDGLFGTDDDGVAPGESRVGSVIVAGSAVDGALASYGVFADTAIGSLSIGGSLLSIPASSGEFSAKTVQGNIVVPSGTFAFSAGSPVVITDTDGDIVSVSLTGPGNGTLSTDSGTLTAGKITSLQLAGTTASASSLSIVVTHSLGGDGIFHADLIEAGDDAGLKGLLAPSLAINGSAGTGISLDGNVGSLSIYSLADGANVDLGGNVGSLTIFQIGTTDLSVGGAVAKITTGPWTGGMFTTRELGKMLVAGNMNADIEVTASALKTGITVAGALSGDIEALMGLDSLAVGGTVDNDVIRAVGSINKLTLGGTVSNSNISTGQDIGTVKAVNISGSILAARGNIGKFTAANLTGSAVLAGFFLGADGMYGTSDDALANGSIKSVALSGNLDTSILAAGVGEGSDGFYGTDDDTSLEGYSSIDKVSVAGTVNTAVGNAIVAGSHLGKIKNGRTNLATLGLLTVATRPNAAGAPRVLLAQQVGPQVVITFTEDILPETINALTVTIVRSGVPQTASSLTYNPTTRQAVWNQGLMFVSGTYTVTVSGTGANFVTDRGGRALDGILINGTYPTGNGIDGSDLVFTFIV